MMCNPVYGEEQAGFVSFKQRKIHVNPHPNCPGLPLHICTKLPPTQASPYLPHSVTACKAGANVYISMKYSKQTRNANWCSTEDKVV